MTQSSTSKQSPRIAVVGAGAWGRNHVRVWHELGCLRAVCDSAASRLEASAALDPNIATFGSFEELLEARCVDALVIATPAPTHAALSEQAMLAGYDVLVEKPMALTVQQGERLVECAERTGRVLMVGHVVVYHSAFVRLQDLLREGELGRVRYIYSNRLSLGRIRTVENSLWSFAPHDVAMILDLVRDLPEEVACHGEGYLNSGVADVTLTAMRFASQVRAHVFVSWLHPFREQRFVVVGDKQMAVFDDTLPWAEKLMLYPHKVNWLHGQLPVAHRAEGVAVAVDESEPLRQECEHFLDCLRHRRAPRSDARAGLEVLKVLEAAQHSLERGGAVEAMRPRREAAKTAVHTSVLVHPSAVVDDGALLGEGTKVWHFSHVSSGAIIGKHCILGQNSFVGARVRLGDGVRLQNNVSVYEGVELEDHVFCGPSMVFTNVINPRSEVPRRQEFRKTKVGVGASLGANSTVICGVTIGRYAFVAAGAVVTRDVPDYATVMGVPARLVGWTCECGEKLSFAGDSSRCAACQRRYRKTGEASVAKVS